MHCSHCSNTMIMLVNTCKSKLYKTQTNAVAALEGSNILWKLLITRDYFVYQNKNWPKIIVHISKIFYVESIIHWGSYVYDKEIDSINNS